VRANPKLSGTKHNVFGIQTGVAISFMVKRVKGTKDKTPARVYYLRRPEMETAEEKLTFLASHPMRGLDFDEVQPDKAGNWVNLTNNDFDTLIPLASKETKAAKTAAKERAIFKLFSLGVVTARDDWVFDYDPAHLAAKANFLIDAYKSDLHSLAELRGSSKLVEMLTSSIKWTRAVKNDLRRGVQYEYDKSHIVEATYRPFTKDKGESVFR
jgi:predicted helicase